MALTLKSLLISVLTLSIFPFVAQADEVKYSSCIAGLLKQTPLSENQILSIEEKKEIALKQCEGFKKSLESFRALCDEKRIAEGHSCKEMVDYYQGILDGKKDLKKEAQTFSNKGNESRLKSQKMNMNMIVEEAKLFLLDKGHLPSSLVELTASLECETQCEGIVKLHTVDSWGNKYIYKPSKDLKMAEFIGLGSDGVAGGAADAEDIVIVIKEDL